MTKTNAREARDDAASSPPVVHDATERHLMKARELLREAHSRLSSRDDAEAGSTANESTGGDEPE